MKKFLLFCCVIGIISQQVNGQSILVHYWNFNSASFAYYLPSIPPVGADYSRISTTAAAMLYKTLPGTSAAYATYVDSLTPLYDGHIDTNGQSWNCRLGAAPGKVIRARNPSDSMQLQFYIPSTHYTNITIKYITQASSATHGPQNQSFAYSTDSGATWRTTALSIATLAAPTLVSEPSTGTVTTQEWTPVTISLNGAVDTAVNNNKKLVFRILFTSLNTGTTGNDRFDNFSVDADTLTTTSTPEVSLPDFAAYSLYPNPVATTFAIASDNTDAKLISIVSASGKTMYMGMFGAKQQNIDVAELPAGLYFVMIRNTVTGETSNLKFNKL
jgi:Secretion system C-terminal sorting domain